MAENKIKAFLIFEMLGRPVEHLKKSLVEFIDKLGKEEGIEIKNKNIHEPKQIEDAKQEIYTAFVETEVEFKDIPTMFKIVFGYMPSNIEIVNPKEINIKNFDLNLLMNELTRRLHQYDEIAKRLAIERNIMQQQLQQAGIQPAIPSAGQTQTQEQAAQPKEEDKKEDKKVKKSKSKKKTGKTKKKK